MIDDLASSRVFSPLMRLENDFVVSASADAVWSFLLDVPQVLPCLPGAELVEVLGDEHWKARLSVKVGPVSMSFLADVTRESVSETDRAATLVVRAREERGRGAATATIDSALTAAEPGAHVTLVTDVQLSGVAAQFGGPVVKNVAASMTRQFAERLQARFAPAFEPSPLGSTEREGRFRSLLRDLWHRVRAAVAF